MTTKAVLAVAAAGVVAAQASADQTIQQDINDLPYQFYDAGGSPSPFGGLTHVGSVDFGFDSFSVHNGVQIQAGAGMPFVDQTTFTGVLTDLLITVDLNNGLVTGGSVMIELDGGSDWYSATITDGFVTELLSGGFTIDINTTGGVFADADFAGVDVSPWMSGPNDGAAILFKIKPSAGGAGYADADVFTVPAPSSALVLVALTGLARRRR